MTTTKDFRKSFLSTEDLPLLMTLLATFLAFAQGLHGGFWLDDSSSVLPAISADPSLGSIFHSTLGGNSGPLGRPLSILSFALGGALHGADPFWFKLENLVLHLFNGILLYHLLQRLHRADLVKLPATITLFVTLAWLIHPMQAGTVLYIVQRMAMLSATFMLLGMHVYLSLRENALNQGNTFRSFGWCTAYFGCLVTALLAKETGALLPLYILVIELAASSPSPRPARLKLIISLTSLLPVLMAVFTFFIGANHFLSGYNVKPFTMPERLITEIHVVAGYVQAILIPRLAGFSLFHDTVEIVQQPGIATVCLMLLHAMLLGWSIISRRAPDIRFGVLWFYAGHALESTFLPLELVFEHRNYLPLLGPIIVLAGLLQRILSDNGWRIALGAWIFLCIAITAARSEAMGNDLVLAYTQVSEHPESIRARSNLITTLQRFGKPEEALEEARKSVAVEDYDSKGLRWHTIFLECMYGEVTDADREFIRNSLVEGIVAPYELSALNVIDSAIARGSCEQIGFTTINAAVLALANNPNANPLWQYNALLRHAQRSIVAKRLEQATELLDIASHKIKHASAVNQVDWYLTMAELAVLLQRPIMLQQTFFELAALPPYALTIRKAEICRAITELADGPIHDLDC